MSLLFTEIEQINPVWLAEHPLLRVALHLRDAVVLSAFLGSMCFGMLTFFAATGVMK